MMSVNDRADRDGRILPFNDFFRKNYKNDNYLRFPGMGNSACRRNVLYLHGALFLFRDGDDLLKIKRDPSKQLKTCIAEKIAQGQFPLFVSEGTASDKISAIGRSCYLNFALTRLKDSGNPLVIYGASLSDPDAHIRDAIQRKLPSGYRRRLAIAVHTKNRTEEELEEEIALMKSRFSHQDPEFFDSSTLFQKPITRSVRWSSAKNYLQ
jgi:hypothetical protein